MDNYKEIDVHDTNKSYSHLYLTKLDDDNYNSVINNKSLRHLKIKGNIEFKEMTKIYDILKCKLISVIIDIETLHYAIAKIYDSLMDNKTLKTIKIIYRNGFDKIENIHGSNIGKLLRYNNRITTLILPYVCTSNEQVKLINTGLRYNTTITSLVCHNMSYTSRSLIEPIIRSNRILKYKLKVLYHILNCKDKQLCKLVIDKVIKYMDKIRHTELDKDIYNRLDKEYTNRLKSLK
jgi:hypothetical protein